MIFLDFTKDALSTLNTANVIQNAVNFFTGQTPAIMEPAKSTALVALETPAATAWVDGPYSMPYQAVCTMSEMVAQSWPVVTSGIQLGASSVIDVASNVSTT